MVLYSGLLIGCGKKWEILPHFQGKFNAARKVYYAANYVIFLKLI